MRIHRIDHIGVIVDDLPAAKAFFLDLGLEVEGEADLAGELVDRVVGLDGVKSSIVMLRTADGETYIELTKFHAPVDAKGIQPSVANSLGIRHIALVVDDIEAIVSKLKKNGTKMFSEIQTYEDSYKLCYVHGPEGIIIELAEQIS